ncbi:MAG: hypothetical protein KDE33_06150 [Bacteroidetes bacterium]|nr:hypothetical protein [Bacteroidota bacterium]
MKNKIKINVPKYISDGLESVFWSFLGNLIPVWMGVIISISDNGLSYPKIYESIHQPFTFLILSASFLTTTLYILRKGSKFSESNNFFHYLYFVLLLIIGFLISKKNGLESLTVNFETKLLVYIIFIISIIFYVYYQFRHFYRIYNPKNVAERETQQENLEDEFDRLNNQNNGR